MVNVKEISDLWVEIQIDCSCQSHQSTFQHVSSASSPKGFCIAVKMSSYFFFLKFCKVKETSIFFHITKFKLLGGDSHHTESLCMEVGWVDRWANILQCLKDNVLIPLWIHCSIFSYKVLIYPKSHSQNLTMSCLSSRHFSTVSLVNYRKYWPAHLCIRSKNSSLWCFKVKGNSAAC